MAFFRIFSKGFKIAVRQKRKNFAMIFVFVILSSTMIIFLANWQKYDSDQLLELRGIVIDFNSPVRANDTTGLLESLLNDIRNEIIGFYVVYAFPVDQFTLMTISKFEEVGSDREIPWILAPFKKSKVVVGRYILSGNEAIAHTGFKYVENISGTIVTQYLDVGSKITFEHESDKVELKIVGLVNSSTEEFKAFAKPGENILLTTYDAFEDIVRNVFREDKSIDRSDRVFVRQVIITVKGDPSREELFDNRYNVYVKVNNFVKDNELDAKVTPGQIVREVYFRDLAFLGVVVLFTIILTFIYSYLIVKGMHFDIATLRAIGWSGKDVVTLVFGQLVFILIVGWLVALFSSLAYYAVLAIPILSAEPFAYSVLVVLFALLVSYLFVKGKVLNIPPMEAFRRG